MFPLFLSLRISKWPDFYGCALLYTYEVLHTSKYVPLVGGDWCLLCDTVTEGSAGCGGSPGRGGLLTPRTGSRDARALGMGVRAVQWLPDTCHSAVK